jgi:CO dehydrogenase/acetyl-CoA synthase beta subunit
MQMSEAMELSDKQLNQIGGYVKQNLGAWMREVVPVVDPSISQNTFERVIRVEEELKASRELMAQGFDFMEKRFAQVEKRFEQIDKRFEQVDKRFEQVDKRFEELRTDMNARFESLGQGQSRMIAWLTLAVTLVAGASTTITLLLGA